MKLQYRKEEVLKGALIYAAGDALATLITGRFMFIRLLAVILIGGGLYAFEIPNYFRWIESFVKTDNQVKRALHKTVLAFIYFNPLWIARHLLLINFFTAQTELINWNLLVIGFWSFFWKIPVSFAGNYIVQVKIPMKWRFFGSAVLSSLFALYYALSEVFFK